MELTELDSSHFEDHYDRITDCCTPIMKILDAYMEKPTLFEYLARRINEISKTSKVIKIVLSERENDDDVCPSIAEYSGFHEDNGEGPEISSEKMYPSMIVLEIYHRDLADLEDLRRLVVDMFFRLVFETVVTEFDLDFLPVEFCEGERMAKDLPQCDYRDNFILEIPLSRDYNPSNP